MGEPSIVGVPSGSWISSTIGAFNNWFNAPFKGPVDVPQVFMIMGVLVISAAIWHRMLHRLHE